MSNDEQTHAPSPQEPEASERQSVHDQPEVDWCLALHIDMVEVEKVKQPVNVTLFLPGMLVTGTIISVEEYMDMQGLADLWNALSPADTDRVPFESRSYIHLKDARFYLSANELTSTAQSGVLWRGKLSSVVGFCQGALSGEIRC